MSNTVALDFGHAMFGSIGGSVFALIVAISCFGALNGWLLFTTFDYMVDLNLLAGSFFTAARLIYVAANEGYLPQAFGRLHKTRGTPVNAMLLQAIATSAFIILGGGFRRLINFAVVASWA